MAGTLLLICGLGPFVSTSVFLVMIGIPLLALAALLNGVERWRLRRRPEPGPEPDPDPEPASAEAPPRARPDPLARDPHGYYAALNLDPRASRRLARDAYRRAALAHHPDHGGTVAAMQRVNAAWAVIGDPDARRRYDTRWSG